MRVPLFTGDRSDDVLGEDALVVEHVSKCFHGLAQKLLQAPTPLLTRAFKGRRPAGIDDPEEDDEEGDDVLDEEEETERDQPLELETPAAVELLWALRDVSFRAGPGEAIALVGGPGSGKTTLLKILAGTLLPSGGRAVLRGRPSPLVANAVQFVVPTNSPRRNAAFVGAFAGVTRHRLRKRLPAIFEFAGIGESEQRGPATLNPAMLALALVLHLDTEVLLLDDPFAVMPAAKVPALREKLKQRLADGAVVVLETPNRDVMHDLCSRAIWLEAGRVAGDGPLVDVLAAYDHAQALGRLAGPAGGDASSRRGFDDRAALAGIVYGSRDRAVRVEIQLEVAAPGLTAQAGVGLVVDESRGYWLEQPEPIPCTPGLHLFEVVVPDLPYETYAGRVEVRLSDGETETTIGRSSVFRPDSSAGPPSAPLPLEPPGVVWEPHPGAWRVLT